MTEIVTIDDPAWAEYTEKALKTMRIRIEEIAWGLKAHRQRGDYICAECGADWPCAVEGIREQLEALL